MIDLSSITWIELAYTLIALLGLVLDIALFHQTFLDYQHLTSLKLNGGRKIVAIGNMRNAFGRGSIQAIELGIGVWATMSTRITAQPTPISLLLLWIAANLAALAYFDHQERHSLKEDFIKYGRRKTDNPDMLALLMARAKELHRQDVILREQDTLLREEDAYLRDRDQSMTEQAQQILDKIEYRIDADGSKE